MTNPTDPHLCLLDPHKYVLEDDYKYVWRNNGQLNTLTVSEDFQTDLASIPSFLWSFINPQDLSLSAPLLHDALYACQGFTYKTDFVTHIKFNSDSIFKKKEVTLSWTRQESDRLFCKVMREEGIGKRKRRMAYYMVRSFGWYSFFGRRNNKEMI